MEKIVPVSRRDLIWRLSLLGFHGPYPGGRHEFLLRDNRRLSSQIHTVETSVWTSYGGSGEQVLIHCAELPHTAEAHTLGEVIRDEKGK